MDEGGNEEKKNFGITKARYSGICSVSNDSRTIMPRRRGIENTSVVDRQLEEAALAVRVLEVEFINIIITTARITGTFPPWVSSLSLLLE